MARITAKAAQQHAAISRDQLDKLGVTRWTHRRLVESGWLVPAAPRVWTVAGAPATWECSLWVATLSLGPTAVVSHRGAAALHGLDRSSRRYVDVTVPRDRRGTGRGVREASTDSAVRLGLSEPVVVEKRLGELRGSGHLGSRTLDRLLLDSGGHTRLERKFLTLIREAGLPRPRTQVVHRAGSRTIARVDFFFDPWGLVVEVSGRHGHSSPAERARDAQRRDELQAIGRTVYEYTWEDVTGRSAMVRTGVRTFLVRDGWTPCSPV